MMSPTELDAGNGQTMVVYVTDDVGDEVDPVAFLRLVAVDASARAARGQRIVSMVGLPLRHSAVSLGREGSGFQTKATVAVVYAAA